MRYFFPFFKHLSQFYILKKTTLKLTTTLNLTTRFQLTFADTSEQVVEELEISMADGRVVVNSLTDKLQLQRQGHTVQMEIQHY